MKIHHKVVGPFFVDEEVEFHGLLDGNAFVRANGVLYLHGLISGDLRVEPGGVAVIHGMVTGFVLNEGATVMIHGMVGSVQDVDPTQPTVISPGASIGPTR